MHFFRLRLYIKIVYSIFRNGSGTISASELSETFKHLNQATENVDVDKLASQMDVNHDGEICQAEFVRVMGAHVYKKHSLDEIRAVFDYFDADKSGKIDVGELQEAFRRMGKIYGKSDIEIMISHVDADHSGRITLDEFAKLLQ